MEENLRQLGRDRLDLVYLRVQRGLKSVSDHVGALLELREAGLVRELGISGVTRAQLREAMDTAPIVSVQNRFGIETSDDSRDVLVECARAEIAFVPFFSIAGTGRHGGPTVRSTLTCWRRHASTTRRPPRSGSRGLSTRDLMC